jgi:hypothetical protein
VGKDLNLTPIEFQRFPVYMARSSKLDLMLLLLGLLGCSGDLPTPPVGHPSEEGIFPVVDVVLKLGEK